MLIDTFAPTPDAIERHTTEIAATPEAVYHALWTADLGGSWIVKGLSFVRSIPKLFVSSARRDHSVSKLTLASIIAAGVGQLAEEPGREVVLGVPGRFWRPVKNFLPFSLSYFQGPVPVGMAIAVWNFTVREIANGRTQLSTETRVVCGDPHSRWKFRAYWLLVRPFSGLIRRCMLRAIRRECERGSPSLPYVAEQESNP